MTSLARHCHESLQQPVRLNIEMHENVIDSTNYHAAHAKHSYRWRCITCVQNWHVKDYAHISTSLVRHGCEQSNEVESRYLQEKVTSLQVESTAHKFTL